MQTFTLDNGDINLLQSALGAAAANARQPGMREVGENPGEYLLVRDRIAAQYDDGPAKQRAAANLERVTNGVPLRDVYSVAYRDLP